jgi:alpha-tubulin suppressor-like RCC1 family protein
MYHTIAIATDDRVYTWGRGLYGVLGNGSNQFSLEPELNDELEYMRKEDPEGKVITKLDSADEYTGALMRDGSLYVWGKNDRGQMGVGSGIGIDMVESENVPREIIFEDKSGEPVLIKDFHAGMNTMLFQDTKGGIYMTGLKLNYTPKKIKLMEEFSDPASI